MERSINYIFNKLTEEGEKDLLHYLLFLPLYILSILYGIGVKTRFFLYRIGLFKTKRLNCKVISIGNITVGGSGKTPMAIFLAQRFLQKGKKPVILSRGYKGKIKDMGVVSDGRNILLGPEDAGDEPYLMAMKLKNIPVIVGKNRYKAGLYAIERFNPDVIILDDGFQHIRLHRDVDIVLIDSKRGFGNGRLLPRGILREPMSELKRASVVMIKVNFSQRLQLPTFASFHGCPILSFQYVPKTLANIRDGSRLDIHFLKGKNVIALSGIADPKSFKNTLEHLGASVLKEISYPDHHWYTATDMGDIAKKAKDAEMIVTTEKDAVKIKSLSLQEFPIYALEVAVEIKDLEGFDKAVELVEEA